MQPFPSVKLIWIVFEDISLIKKCITRIIRWSMS